MGTRGKAGAGMARNSIKMETPRMRPPSGKTPAFRKQWRALVDCVAADYFEEGDRPTMESYCHTVLRLQHIRGELETAPALIEGNGGMVKPNPLYQLESMLTKDLLAHCRALRLNPNARSEVNQRPKVEAKPKDDTPAKTPMRLVG